MGCGKEETESNDPSTESKSAQVEEQSGSASRENNDIGVKDILATINDKPGMKILDLGCYKTCPSSFSGNQEEHS